VSQNIVQKKHDKYTKCRFLLAKNFCIALLKLPYIGYYEKCSRGWLSAYH